MEKVLITGATSYLGQVLCRQHLERGDDVSVLIRPTSDRVKLDRGLKPDHILIDDGNQETLCRLMAECQPDLLHHLASFYVRSPEAGQVTSLMEAGLTFGTRVLEALRHGGRFPRIVNATSHAIFFETNSPRPLNLYAATKLAFETILTYFGESEGLRFCSLVLFDTYGPGDPRAKLMTAIPNAIQSGTTLPLTEDDFSLDLVHIEDAARAFVIAGGLLKEDKLTVGGHYAVSQGERIMTSDLVALFEEMSGRTVEKEWSAYSLPERKILEPWTGLALPHWKPRVTLKEGVREMLQAVGTK